MKITVAEYANSRKISEATVKAAINRLALELAQNPLDKRQRLLSLAQQAQLDQAIPKANAPSATPTVPTEVMPYQRPTEVGMVLAEHSLTMPDDIYNPRQATENPLFLALQQRVESMKAQNQQINQQVAINRDARRDTDAAIESLRKLRIMQEAQAQAASDFQLKQQVYDLATQDLEMQAAGLSPVPTPAAAPVAPTAPRPAATDHSKSPF